MKFYLPFVTIGVLLILPPFAPLARAQSASLRVIHTFNLAVDGSSPTGPLIQGSDGNLYGTAGGSGSPNPDGTRANYGSIFRITQEGVFTTLHSFNGTDGTGPNAGVIQASDGNFYGTTYYGGILGPFDTGMGSVFRLTPDGSFTTLHLFTGADGHYVPGGLIQAADGNLYGLTASSSANSNGGTMFRVSLDGTFTNLGELDTAPPTGKGLQSSGTLIQAADGKFYNTCSHTGVADDSNIYSVTPGGPATIVHHLADNTEGSHPRAGLIQARDGNFYGTTTAGGPGGSTQGYGTLFRVTAAGDFTVLHAFDSADGDNYGFGPYAENTLMQASDGTLYGAATYGGPGTEGLIFSFSPDGTYHRLFGFGTFGDDIYNRAGATPACTLVQTKDGRIYGTAYNGGVNGNGTIYEVVTHRAFFKGEVDLGRGAYYLKFPGGKPFGYYSFLDDPEYLYHFDLGYEYVFDAADGKAGVYFYDFKSGGFFYTSPSFPFPYLYDFSLNSVVYYYPDPTNPERYNTNGIRYFYVFRTGRIISK